MYNTGRLRYAIMRISLTHSLTHISGSACSAVMLFAGILEWTDQTERQSAEYRVVMTDLSREMSAKKEVLVVKYTKTLFAAG